MVRGHRSEEEESDAEEGCVSSQQNLLELCGWVWVWVWVSTSMSEGMGRLSQGKISCCTLSRLISAYIFVIIR